MGTFVNSLKDVIAGLDVLDSVGDGYLIVADAQGNLLGKVQGGVTPTPTPVPLVEIFKDQACTTKPQVGDELNVLYARINGKITEDKAASGTGDFESCNIYMSTGAGAPWEMNVFVDFYYSNSNSNPFVEGAVIPVSAGGESITIGSPLKTEFFVE